MYSCCTAQLWLPNSLTSTFPKGLITTHSCVLQQCSFFLVSMYCITQCLIYHNFVVEYMVKATLERKVCSDSDRPSQHIRYRCSHEVCAQFTTSQEAGIRAALWLRLCCLYTPRLHLTKWHHSHIIAVFSPQSNIFENAHTDPIRILFVGA